MKKAVIFSTFILFIIALKIKADTQTTGNMKLLLPSLNTVDSSRSWADKLNENFKIIDSTVTNVQTAVSQIQTDTTTISNVRNTTGTWTGTQNFSSGTFSSTLSVTSQNLSIAGNNYVWQSSAPQSGNNLLQRSGSRIIWGGDNAGTGGGVAAGNSTTTVTLFHSGGQVFIATSPLIAIDGLAGTPVIASTFHAITLRAYTMSSSTVGVTKFQLVFSTSNQGAFPFNNWGPQIHSSTGGAYGTAVSTSLAFNPASSYALHIDSIPVSGTMPSTYGIQADGWYDSQ